MKLTTIILLMIPLGAFCQQGTGQNDLFSISGNIILNEGDRVSRNRLALITDLNSKDNKNSSRPFDIDSAGYFQIQKLPSGRYKLSILTINKDYNGIDTILYISDKSLDNIELKISKRRCDYDAKKDINSNTLKILVGIGNAPRMNSKEDDKFEKRYKIDYVVFGDARIESQNCLKSYNKTIFEYLDNRFGSKWRKKVRKDTI